MGEANIEENDMHQTILGDRTGKKRDIHFFLSWVLRVQRTTSAISVILLFSQEWNSSKRNRKIGREMDTVRCFYW